jgi:hypothetical protein
MIMTPELNEELRRDVEALLHRVGIANSYGWQNADDADPEFIGHAMWQTDAPLDDFFESESDSATRPDVPEWLKRIALEGTDFEGLVQAARMSIGLFLIQANLSQDNIFHSFNHGDLFDLHWMSSIIYLSTASDRIRSLFVAAAFRKTSDEYEKGKYNGQGKSRYTTPFFEAKDCIASSSTIEQDALARLPDLAEEVHQLRKVRNGLVHELATSLALRRRSTLNQPPQPRRHRALDFASLQKLREETEANHRRRLSENTKQLGDWFDLLMRMGSDVFIVEHYRRAR